MPVQSSQTIDKAEVHPLAYLKEQWGFSLSDDIELVGRVPKDVHFPVLITAWNPKTKKQIVYPGFSNSDSANCVYVKTHGECSSKWILMNCELAPDSIRSKRNNPYHLNCSRYKILEECPEWIKQPVEDVVIDIPEIKVRLIRKDYLNYMQGLFQKDKEAIEAQTNALKEESHRCELLKEQKKKELEEIHRKQNQELKALQQIQGNKSEEIAKVEKLKSFIKERAQLLLNLDLLEEDEVNNIFPESKENSIVGYSFMQDLGGNEENLIGYIQRYAYEKGYFYSRDLLKDFFALIRTNDLIVLAGDSGSGKSSICKLFANAVGGEAVIVPVKPNWTCNEDLMGYYNPIEHKYLVTPFLTALMRAASDPNRLYILCLDEMNIARVEYYFADFLSLMEEREQMPVFDLFRSTDAKSLRSEISNFVSLAMASGNYKEDASVPTFLEIMKNDEARDRFNRMCGIGEAETMLKYHAYLKARVENTLQVPDSLVLPHNVRIVGTVNIDDTTHYLSPKILDRVNVIKFSSADVMRSGRIEEELGEYSDFDLARPVCLNSEELGLRKPYPKIDETNHIVQLLTKWGNEYLSKLGIEFGYRAIRQAMGYAQEMSGMGEHEAVIINNIILHKVLPKIVLNGDVKRDGKSNRMRLEEFCRALEEEIGKHAPAVTEIEGMIEKSESYDGQINWWLK